MKESIDFVLPWVDGNDPKWQSLRKRYARRENDRNDNHARFRDMGTLRYVLRSIETYCPWYGKIHLITQGHTPSWLDSKHPRIRIVTHRELFVRKEALPVFNSNAIEMNLVNIPELSERFVYLNDDTFIWQPLLPTRFFQNGKPVDFFAHSWFPRKRLYRYLRGHDSWIDALYNNLALINRHTQPTLNARHLFHPSYTVWQKMNNAVYRTFFKHINWLAHWHHPQPYTKTTIRNVFDTFKDDMLRVSTNKFRDASDLTVYLYRYWHLSKGDFEPYFFNDAVVIRPTSQKDLQKQLYRIKRKKDLSFVCINDQTDRLDKQEFDAMKRWLSSYMIKKFPQKAGFEH